MKYSTFLFYNVIGALLWVSLCGFAGYIFGNIPLVKKNFELAILGIIFISVLPMLIEFLKHRAEQKKTQLQPAEVVTEDA